MNFLTCTPEGQPVACFPRRRVCLKPVADRSTQPTAFRSRPEVLQTRHKYVRSSAFLAEASLDYFCRSDKAVAVGAISFHLDHFVKGRISKFAYGVPYCVPYKRSDPEHIRREHKAYKDELGDKYIPDAFDTMLSKVRHQIVPVKFIRSQANITGL